MSEKMLEVKRRGEEGDSKWERQRRHYYKEREGCR